MPKRHKPPFTRRRGFLLPMDPLYYTTTTTTVKKGTANPIVATSSGCTTYPGYNGHDMVDKVTPGYRALSGQGKMIISPCTKRQRTAEILPAAARSYTRTYIGSNPPNSTVLSEVQEFTDWAPSPNHSPFPSVVLPDFDALKQQAINEAFANAHQRDVMGIVDLAEMDKTFAMISTNLGRLDKIRTKSLFKGNLGRRKYRGQGHIQQYKAKTPAGRVADAAGLWLEVQYGVIPLMMSIEGLIKALSVDGNASKSNKRQTFRGGQRSGSKYDETYTQTTSGWGNINIVTDWIHEVDFNYNARAGVVTTYKPSLKARLGMEARDLVPAAYELIKYSFVLDWFFDLGTYLEAVTPVKGFSTSASWTTLLLEEIHTYRMVRHASQGNYSNYNMQYHAYEASYVETIHDYIRTPGGVPGIPNLDRDFRSYTHLISAAALLLSRKKSKWDQVGKNPARL